MCGDLFENSYYQHSSLGLLPSWLMYCFKKKRALLNELLRVPTR